jgi:hypothetical protein
MLGWGGPTEETSSSRKQRAHHLLPVLMHHFGCACPSHEALEILRVLAAGRTIIDAGSGGGYWTWMLRRYGVASVAVDSAQSDWRVDWLSGATTSSSSSSDSSSLSGGHPATTVRLTATSFLAQPSVRAGRDHVLLLVYPIVGTDGNGAFTRRLLGAYRGDTLAVVGTQGADGYTSFRDETMDAYMAREQPVWTRVAQIPLPAFAGKDEAMYVFQRGQRAPKGDSGKGREG